MTVPIIDVSAGFSSSVADHLETYLDLNWHLIKYPSATFFARIDGNSMLGAGIYHGDLLVSDRSLTASSGRFVVAVVNGKHTVKRYYQGKGKQWLAPENPKT
jgi:DNA polymerase V